MSKRKAINQVVTWLSEEITKTENVSNSFHYYERFQFKKITAGIGDFVLVSNADSAEPDTEEGCDAAQILHLYEDTYNKTDPFRAKVQWYSKPCDLPNWCFNSRDPINFIEREVVQDHRPFDTDVSIETFFKKCKIILAFTKDVEFNNLQPYQYICRYRLTLLSKRKGFMEPVMEQERDALKLLCTPNKPIASPRNCSKTPTSLVKKMSSISLSDQKDWSVSKNNGTKLLLKRAILTDTTEKKSPMKSTPKASNQITETPKANKTKKNFEEIVLAELRENSDDELPTLIIKKIPPSTPKRKQSISKPIDESPKKMLICEDNNQASYSTRFGRTIRNTVSYQELQLSPVKKTPKKLIHRLRIDEDSDDDFKPAPRTPKTPKTPKTPRTPRSTATTPRNKVTRRIITSQLTPTLQSRAHSVDNSNAFLKQDESLPGREKQLEEILSFVRSKLLDGVSGCMYISGVPGTGKTATVCKSLKILKEEVDLPDFQLVEVNGMKIAEPRQAYVQIYKQLTGKSVVWEHACSLLEKRFTTPGPRRTPTVLLVDELDALCTRRQDVLYSIVEWASRAAARLTVLAVANTMDLPERALAARVASRLGLTRLPFAPYTHAQLQRIVAARLAAAGATVAPDAVQLIARKVASVSGDARRALALCSRALELGGGGGGGGGGAGMREVQLALAEAASSATARAIRACAPAERLMLRAIAAEVERTGSDETTLSRALRTAAALVSLEGRPYRAAPRVRAPTPAQARAACARLADTRLLVLEPMHADAKLLLNVSTDDVHYATREITV